MQRPSEAHMKRYFLLACFALLSFQSFAQALTDQLSSLPTAKDYVQHRSSSYDRSGGNGDARQIATGETLTLLDESGPGLISHVWVTIASDDPHHLKALVLRMYWTANPRRVWKRRLAIFLAWVWENIFFINRRR
jgi:hypothetical protein